MPLALPRFRSVSAILAVLGSLSHPAAAQSCPTAPPTADSPAGAIAHVAYLAADALEGRDTGSDGERCAAAYIAARLAAIGLRPAGTDGWYQSFDVAADARAGRAAVVGTNVVGVLPGSDLARADEWIVIGAHFDHLGLGGAGSLDAETRAIHNGADDNASGTAALIEVARALARAGGLARPVVFVAFSGEERGLLGSSWFARNPTVDLADAVAMLNMDMVGRLRDDRITVFGEATAEEWAGILDAANASLAAPLEISRVPDGFGPSDHSSFYGMGIPVQHFFTGTHSEYHRSIDDTETLNAEGLDRVVDLVAAAAIELAGSPDDAPAVVTAIQGVAPEASEGGRGYGPYFGSIPDMGAADVTGVRVSGVRENSPADRAGLVAGDVIVGFGEFEIGDLYDYTDALRAFEPGDAVNITVERDGARLVLQAVLGERR